MSLVAALARSDSLPILALDKDPERFPIRFDSSIESCAKAEKDSSRDILFAREATAILSRRDFRVISCLRTMISLANCDTDS